MTRLAQHGFTVYPVRISRSLNVVSHLAAVFNLYRLMRKGRFDIVHVHTPVASIVGRIAARLARVPLIIYTAHGFYFHDNMSSRSRASHVLLERELGRLTDFLFTQSAEDAETAARERIMPESQIRAIGNGVVLGDFVSISSAAIAAWRERLGISEAMTVVGTIGRLVEEKGFREFFRAAAMVAPIHPAVIFLVVGDLVKGDRGPFKAEMARLVEGDPHLRGRVRFSGFTEDIPVLMQLIDIFVLASYREGMPRSIIEAMAAGKPVVASDIRGCREEVVNEETGFIVPVRDADALAERIMALVADPGMRQTLGAAGRRRAEALFNEDEVAGRVISTIEDLLEAKRLVRRFRG